MTAELNIYNAESSHIIAVIQTKYDSNVFPGKSLARINGKTVLQIISSRLKKSHYIKDVIVATTTSSSDKIIVEEVKRLGLKCFCGDDQNVIKRLLDAALTLKAENIVKVLGNYPLLDVYYMDKLIDSHMSGNYDYSYNEYAEGIVYGMGCEVVSVDVLKDISKKGLSEYQLESGSIYFRQHEYDFSTHKQYFELKRPQYKLCIENNKDLMLLEEIFKRIEEPDFLSVVDLLDDSPILSESNRYEGTKEVGKEKLFLFPDKLKELNNVGKMYVDYTYPISVELSLTHRCNLSCIWCSDRKIRERSAGEEISFNTIISLIDDLSNGGTKGIVIEGGGEPSLYEHFEKVVNYIKSKGMSIGLISNGLIPVKTEIADCFDWIRISLDACNHKEYKELKNSEDYEAIINNIKQVTQSSSVIGVGYVLTNKNDKLLEPLVLRLKEYGIDYIQIRSVIDHPEYMSSVDLSYLKRYETSDFTILLDGIEENSKNGNMSMPCRSHSLTSVITADGDVYLCGRLNIHDWLEPIGNIKKDSFYNIWHGQKRTSQSTMVTDEDFCSRYCPPCRLVKFNKLLDSTSRIKTKNFI